MRPIVIALVVAHALALGLGLFGILVAIPHPQWWAGNPADAAFFAWALARGGAMGMVSGAIAMVVYGVWAIGWRRTLLFLVVSCVISASAELTGTATGWPFGGYEYTSFLGWKILGRVPYGVPLSWFYMGLASYLLALLVARRYHWSQPTLRSLLLGTWLLTAWDLVLDPAMASPSMAYIHFWVWHESGPYYGMPLRNLVGWFATGLLYIAVARALWRDEPPSEDLHPTIPFAVYAINVVWAMILALSAGLWPTALAAIALSLIPAALALGNRPRRRYASGLR